MVGLSCGLLQCLLDQVDVGRVVLDQQDPDGLGIGGSTAMRRGHREPITRVTRVAA